MYTFEENIRLVIRLLYENGYKSLSNDMLEMLHDWREGKSTFNHSLFNLYIRFLIITSKEEKKEFILDDLQHAGLIYGRV